MRRQSTLRQPILPYQFQLQTKTISSPNTPLTADSNETRLSYFSSCSPKTPVPILCPSGGTSTPSCLATDSPSSSASNEDSTHMTYSLEANHHLTPPEFQSGPRRHSSDSLIITHPKTSTRVRARRKSRMRKRLIRLSHCEFHRQEARKKESRPYWWLPGSKVKNSAPEGFRDTQSNQIPCNEVLRKSIHVSLDSHEDVPARLLSLPIAPIISRRWSSVLAGTHSRYCGGILEPHGRHKKSSSETEDYDIIMAVRQKLTQRKLETSKLETPASTAMRRASRMSIHHRIFQLSNDINTNLNKLLVPRDDNQVNGEGSIYLITSRDIELITRLIRSSISSARSYSTNSTFTEIQEPNSESPAKSNHHSGSEKHPSLSKRGFHPRASIAADVAITVADITPARHISLLNVAPVDHGGRRQSSVTKVFCRKSVHEIIWEIGSPIDSSAFWKTPSGEEIDSRDSPLASCSQTFEKAMQDITDEIPQSMTTRSLLDDNLVSEEQSCGSLIFHWEFKEPILADSEVMPAFESNYSLPNSTTMSDLRMGTTDLVPPKLSAVTSFPALIPRKSTGDWISPPPDIAAIMNPPDRAMYDVGIDTVGIISPAPSPPVAPQFKKGDFNARKTDTEDQNCIMSNSKARKSVIIRHPQDVARVGELSKQGHAVGVSSGLRRTSSTRLTRIRFESFHNNVDLEDRKPWKKPRKDSGYPLRRSNSATSEWSSRKVSLLSEESNHRRTSKSYEHLNNAANKSSKDVQERKSSKASSRDPWKNRGGVLPESSPVLAAVDNAGSYVTLSCAQKRKTSDEIRQEERTNSLVVDGNDCLRPTPDFGNLNDVRQPNVDWVG